MPAHIAHRLYPIIGVIVEQVTPTPPPPDENAMLFLAASPNKMKFLDGNFMDFLGS